MSRRILLGLLAYGLLLLGLAWVKGSLIVLALPLWLYLGVALWHYPAQPNLAITRTVNPPIATEGMPVRAILSLRNEEPQAVTLLIEAPAPVALELRDGDTRCLARLAPQETLELRHDFGARRGRFDFPDVHVTSEEPLGLFEQTLLLRLKPQILVLPQFKALRSIGIRPRRTLGFTGPIPARQGGTGVDIYAVREYQPGDPLRRINWRATARYHDRAFTTEFEQERITDVGLILDVRRHTALQSGSEALLDHGVRATAALAARLLRDGHRVGLLLYGEGNQWVVPGYGRVQQARILRALAAAAPAESGFFDSLNFLSSRAFPPRSQLIFVSPLALGDGEMLFRLRGRGYSVWVLSLDMIGCEATMSPLPSPLAIRLARIERTLLLRRLQQGGIVTVDWPLGTPLEECLLTMTGRAVQASGAVAHWK
ncbi:MAG: DUF58 domain-containing protein [Anaerolineae bacterium]|nr:DUF58 domain-containing protein [Anaerolineae bacterium]